MGPLTLQALIQQNGDSFVGLALKGLRKILWHTLQENLYPDKIYLSDTLNLRVRKCAIWWAHFYSR